MAEIQTDSEFKSPPATPTHALKQNPRVLCEDDLQNIYAALTKGDGGLARRRDLGEMHKRLIAMITTLNQGVGDVQVAKAAADRAELGHRLDQMEHAVNSMDGALRIELAPMLRTIVEDAVRADLTKKNAGSFSKLLTAVAFVAGLAFGTIYSSQVTSFSNQALSMNSTSLKNIDTEPSLIRGSVETANLMK